MTSRPSRILPGFGTDDTYTSGPHTGEPTKIEPITGEKAQGWHPGKRPPAKKINWLLNKLFQWVDYLADTPLLNWYVPVFQDLNPAAFDNTFLRRDGTAEVFWSSFAGWILLGSNTAGSIWNGDFDFYQKVASGVGGPPKMSFGCETNTQRLLLFDSTTNGAGSHTSYLRSNIGALGWTLLNLGNATTSSRACDVVRIDGGGLGRIVVCGYKDGNYEIWKSDDGGATFTPVAVGALVAAGVGFDRIIVGKNGLLIAWPVDTAANGGNQIWYSSDYGDNWAARNVGFDNIIDAVYMPDDDVYVFLRSGELRRCADPIGGAFTTLTAPAAAPLSAIASFGSAVVVAGVPASNIQSVYMSWDTGDHWRKVWTSPVGFTGYPKIFHIGVDPDGGMFAWGNTFVRRSLKAAALGSGR